MSKKKTEKKYLLYDGRYRTDEDKAVCYEMCDSLKEANENKDDYGTDTVIVECEVSGNNLINSKTIN
jgi:hypothetical protein